MPKTEEKVTDEQASSALMELLSSESGEPKPAVEPVSEGTQQEQEPEPDAQQSEQEGEPIAASDETASDDVESLKKRLSDLEKAREDVEKQAAQRTDAIRQRFEANERILRDRYVRKSDVTSKALAVLKTIKTGTGIAEADVDRMIRELEGTMNPASASYVEPEPQAAGISEDQQIALNNFLNEKAMTQKEADEFGNWIKNEAATAMTASEQAVARQSIDGFLRIAHSRYRDAMAEKANKVTQETAVGAVRSVQRTQREAARAASAMTTAPKRTSPAPAKTEIDYKKLTKQDISDLLKASVEQYR